VGWKGVRGGVGIVGYEEWGVLVGGLVLTEVEVLVQMGMQKGCHCCSRPCAQVSHSLLH
jgi:hypothetical protein